MASPRTPSGQIRLVVFDLAGTTVDYGSRAPAGAFVELFARHGLTVSEAQARAPMGQHKRDHIRSMLSEAALRAQWRAVRGADWTAADVEALFEEFIPLQMACLPRFAEVIPGVTACLGALRERGVAVATTTGYNRAMTDLVLGATAAEGFVPDASVAADEVPAGRPAPWMVFAGMQRLGVYPPWAVVKVGDTVVDVQEGLNAGAWSVGVAATGNLIGLTASAWSALPADERSRRLQTARATLVEAGAHAVIDAVADVPALLADFEARLARGERP